MDRVGKVYRCVGSEEPQTLLRVTKYHVNKFGTGIWTAVVLRDWFGNWNSRRSAWELFSIDMHMLREVSEEELTALRLGEYNVVS